MDEDHRNSESPSKMTENALTKRNKIFDLVDGGKWLKLRLLLKFYKKRNIDITNVTECTGLTPLAYAASCNAPTDIIRAILDADPESSTKTDDFSSTAIHLACLNGTTIETVKMILESDNHRSAAILDRNSCSVLHHAVEFACVLIEERYISSSHKRSPTRSTRSAEFTIESEHKEYLEIIQLLCDAVPESVHHTEMKGDTPLDIPFVVLMKHVKPPLEFHLRLMEVYEILKKTSIKVYRKQKEEWERLSPVEPTKGIPRNDCDKSLVPSLNPSNASSSILSHNLSCFKDSVALSDKSFVRYDEELMKKGLSLEDTLGNLRIV